MIIIPTICNAHIGFGLGAIEGRGYVGIELTRDINERWYLCTDLNYQFDRRINFHYGIGYNINNYIGIQILPGYGHYFNSEPTDHTYGIASIKMPIKCNRIKVSPFLYYRSYSAYILYNKGIGVEVSYNINNVRTNTRRKNF